MPRQERAFLADDAQLRDLTFWGLGSLAGATWGKLAVAAPLIVLALAGATGAAVAVSGGIGFVGIVVPHLLRLVIGPDHRWLLPNAALLGASLLILADRIARSVVAPAELPIGIVTATLGGPLFLWILMRHHAPLNL